MKMKSRISWLVIAVTAVALAVLPGRVEGSWCLPECFGILDCIFGSSPLCDYCDNAIPVIPGECVIVNP